jgi:thiol-disulfide isomerase/thioredoxin
MQNTGGTSNKLEIAHITVDGKEIDEETKINPKEVTTQKSSDVLRMFNANKPMFIKFYANWCGHCHTIDKPWKELVAEVKSKHADKNVAIVSVESKIMNADINKIVAGAKGLGKVDGFPTIGLIHNKKWTSYDGDRSKKAMFKYMEDEVINKKMAGGAGAGAGGAGAGSGPGGAGTTKKHKRKTVRRHRKTSIRKSRKRSSGKSKRSSKSKRSGKSKRSSKSKRSGSSKRN